MAARTYWSHFFFRKSARKLSRVRTFRPRLEGLEDRTLLSASVLFDPVAGNLSILGDGADTTVRQTFSSGGFLEVSVDGQSHSSDPASAFFDPALAGAMVGSLAGIHFDSGGGHDTLILAWDGFQNRPTGSLTVSAAGVDVVTQDVSVAGDLTIQGQRIQVDGTLRAGAVGLSGSGWVTVEAKGLVAADQIDVSAGVFVNSGQLHADGLVGGQIFVSADKVLNGGTISADGGGQGGSMRVAFTNSYIDTSAAVTSADGKKGEPGALALGGKVTIDGGATGHLFSSGAIQATGSFGGQLDLFGREIELVGASVDASGEAGGGSIRIGGGFHGNVGQVANFGGQDSNAPLANAQTVTVTAATSLRADARSDGPGGRVVVWSDQNTTFGGSVSARGGPASGNGGFIEVSGLGNLDYAGTADTSAPAGKAGTLLLDPKNLVIDAVAGVSPQFDFVDPHPTTGAQFGSSVTVLNNGNVVVQNPKDDFGGAGAGAVYLYDGLTGALLSALVGSSAGANVGGHIYLIGNGNYVVQSLQWNGNLGAVTWCSGTAGLSGAVSPTNSLVGSAPGDNVGSLGILILSSGNYLVQSPKWNGNAGAVTWGSGSAGVTGAISATNSLIGSNPGDFVGVWDSFSQISGLTVLSNGNYVVGSPYWNGRGAATWGSGTAGVSGTISSANSLVGGNESDGVSDGRIYALSNGNYVVQSSYRTLGAVTWGDGTAGVRGFISQANSLVGSNPGDSVGRSDTFAGITPLSNGNYVVSSAFWNNDGVAENAFGAVTWADGTVGITGTISASNSLVGSNPGDRVGSYFSSGVAALSNGNYVVPIPYWNGGRGAATWGSGTEGVHGTISETNSLLGSNAGDFQWAPESRL
jgi:hypothetical protein